MTMYRLIVLIDWFSLFVLRVIRVARYRALQGMNDEKPYTLKKDVRSISCVISLLQSQ
jgi:hypothetical protein